MEIMELNGVQLEVLLPPGATSNLDPSAFRQKLSDAAIPTITLNTGRENQTTLIQQPNSIQGHQMASN